jgi:hydroxymethylpyrimidine pyrophosphatase-like HAD family hydrolase
MMRYQALACDYDGTLATRGVVLPRTISALEDLVATGRRLILVTGRRMADLETLLPRPDLFARIVAENGAVLGTPATHEKRVLAAPPPEGFARRLGARGVDVSRGEVVIAMSTPHEVEALETIRELGLELQVTFNKGAVMVLPSGVNKRSGLQAGLAELGLSFHNCVGVGDAENDHVLLEACECGVAVANALPALRETADLVTAEGHGAGVEELARHLLRNDLADAARPRVRHSLLVAKSRPGDAEVRMSPLGTNLLVAGSSGSGKSSFAAAVLERHIEAGYQVCVVDPEGDYAHFEGMVSLGTPTRAPTIDEIAALALRSDVNVVANLLGIPHADRPVFFSELFLRLQELRARFGRPHFILLDEAHQLLPATPEPTPLALPNRLEGTMLVTVHPDRVALAALRSVDVVVAVGERPAETLAAFARTVGQRAPELAGKGPLEEGEVALWNRGERTADRAQVVRAKAERQRHVRRYVSGELGDHSFIFRGPEGRLNLRAQNLTLFLQMGEGVDDETWLFHLRNGDVERWFRERIKDPELAADAARAARAGDPAESRKAIRAAVERRYAPPA